MNIFTTALNTLANAADSAYRYVLPRSALEYAGAGVKAVGRLAIDLMGDGVSTIVVVFKALGSATLPGLKSCWNAGKGFFLGFAQSSLLRISSK